MKNWSIVMDPLRGKTSLARVFWVYGVLGSLLVSALGIFIGSGNEFATRAYIAFGLLFSIYVTVATYQCAGNCQSKAMARLVRISAIITLVLLPVFAYFEFTGAIDVALSNVNGEL